MGALVVCTASVVHHHHHLLTLLIIQLNIINYIGLLKVWCSPSSPMKKIWESRIMFPDKECTLGQQMAAVIPLYIKVAAMNTT